MTFYLNLVGLVVLALLVGVLLFKLIKHFWLPVDMAALALAMRKAPFVSEAYRSGPFQFINSPVYKVVFVVDIHGAVYLIYNGTCRQLVGKEEAMARRLIAQGLAYVTNDIAEKRSRPLTAMIKDSDLPLTHGGNDVASAVNIASILGCVA